MSRTEHIREVFERNRRALELRPEMARSTASTTCRTSDGLTCEISDGAYKMMADEPKSEGGNERGPPPSFFIRAGLASCCAMSYVICAARAGVPIDSFEVEVESDFDARGPYGLADLPHGITEVRRLVKVRSSASEAEILKVIEAGDKMSSMLKLVRDSVPMKREVRIERPREA